MSLPRITPCYLHLAFICAFSLSQLACGGGGGGSNSGGGGGGTPTITSVSVSGPANIQSPYCSNFIANVQGTGNYDRTVQWYVDDVLGGSASNGLIDATGDYCAPPQPPPGNPVTIKAVARADSTKSGSATTRVITISITPTSTQMYVGDQQQFAATVAGAVNNSITWEVNGVVGGNSSIGTISQAGLYTAPAQVTDVGIAVEASSTDPTIAATANITVNGKIVISPSPAQITYGTQQQFTASIIGANDTQINWYANSGAITPAGLYTASGTQSPDTITAWSAHARGSLSIQVVAPTPTITSITPQPATVLDQITITGTNLNTILTAEFSDAIGGHVPVVATNVTGTSATVSVPQGAVSGNLYVTSSMGGLAPAQSNTVQFQRLARLRVYTPKKDLSAGESVSLQYALLGDSTPRSVSFSADVGSFSGSTYLAPGSVTADTFAHVTGCISGTTSCSSIIIALHPFRIEPDVPIVPAANSLQLSAELGSGTTSAKWNLLSGQGALSSNGLYTAGSALLSGGPAIVSAVSGGVTESSQVGVTGKFPGLLNRIYEYADQHDPNFQGAFPYGLAILGNRAFVPASNYIGTHTDSYYWMDVYDITDPVHPVWLTAIETYSADLLPAFGGQYLYSYNTVAPIDGAAGAITLYQVVNGIPLLKARAPVTQPLWNTSWNNGIISMVPNGVGTSKPGFQEIWQYDLTGGQIVFHDIQFPLAPDTGYYLPYATLQVGNRFFMSMYNNDASAALIATYDTSGPVPTLTGTVDGISLGFYSSGNLLFGAESGMDVYDISGQLPVFQSHVDNINAALLNGTQLLAITAQQGCLLLDISQPASPKVTATLFDGVITGCDNATFVGSYVMASEYVGGIAVYDASQSGGPVVNSHLFGGGWFWADAYDLLYQPPYLFAAASTGVGAVLNVYDASTTPANRVGQYFDQNQEAFSVQSSGNYMYLGGSSYMSVLDATQPAAPALVTTIPVPATSMIRVNNTLFAGTVNNSLVIMDLTNPAAPAIVNTIPLPDLPIRVRVFGNLLMVADNTAGLFIYDISSPQSPKLLSQTTNMTLAADVAVVGNTAFVAADIDGLDIFNITNPSAPTLVSKTALGRIDPFYSDNPSNEALTVAVNNGIAYIGTINDNGIVFGLDIANLSAPRIVSIYGHGDFIVTWVGSLLFNGTEMYLAGSLGYLDPVEQVDMSQPYDSINQYFPPLALQNIPQSYSAHREPPTARQSADPHGGRFPRRVPPPQGTPSRNTPRRF